MLAQLAWQNIWRQPHRTILSLSSIALACVITILLLAIQLGSYGTIKQNTLRLVDGFAQIQPPGYSENPDLDKTIAHFGTVMARIEHVPGVTAVAPRATTYVILSNGPRSYAAAVLGVDPRRERNVSSLTENIRHGRYLIPTDTDAVVMGAALARNLKVSTGAKITMLGSARDGSIAADVLRVAGIFTTGSPQLDRRLVEMPLQRFQSDFAMAGRVNTIAVLGHSLADIQDNLPALRNTAHKDGLVVRDWSELEPAIYDAILLDFSISLLFYASLIVIVVFIILNTLLMSVLERTHEFGMLMAIGMKPGRIGRMIWMELVFLSGTGAAIGIALGAAITTWLGYQGITFAGADALFAQWHMSATLYPQLGLTSALAGPLAITVAIAVSGIVPYMRARRLRPVSAMRAT